MGWTNPKIPSSEQCLSTASCRAHFSCTGHPPTSDISSSPCEVSSVTACPGFPDFCRAGWHAILLDKAVKMPISTASKLVPSARQRAAEHRFPGDGVSPHEHWDWNLLECWTSDSAGSYTSLLGLINAPLGHTPDGRGK